MSEPKATACVPAWAADPELVVAIEAFYGHCAETGAEQEAEPRPLAVGLGGWLADYTARVRREGGEDAKTELLRLIGEYGEAREAIGMRFGEKIRELRKAKLLGQRALADMVGVSFTYVSKVENEKLDFGDYPSEDLIRRLAEALDADADELLLLAKKIPEEIKSRVLERPDAFRKIAKLDDAELDDLLREIDRREQDK